MNVKQELYEMCYRYVAQRTEVSRQAISEAKTSADQETKSSAGDKYETGRAMMHLEMEKNAGQLEESVKLKHVLDTIHLDTSTDSAQPGSLVTTDRGEFFIAISIGEVTLEGKPYFVISAASPIGQKLIGLKAGDKMTFRNQTYTIERIL